MSNVVCTLCGAIVRLCIYVSAYLCVSARVIISARCDCLVSFFVRILRILVLAFVRVFMFVRWGVCTIECVCTVLFAGLVALNCLCVFFFIFLVCILWCCWACVCVLLWVVACKCLWFWKLLCFVLVCFHICVSSNASRISWSNCVFARLFVCVLACLCLCNCEGLLVPKLPSCEMLWNTTFLIHVWLYASSELRGVFRC